MRASHRGALGGVLAALLVALAAACGGSTEVQFEVIEDVEFSDILVDASNDTLAFDLAMMTKIDSVGIYYQDVVVGTGDSAAVGDSVFIRYTGWLRNGLQFDAGSLGYRFFYQGIIAGLQLGMQGQQVDGDRLIVIPPEWGYGGQAAGPIYPGAVLIFRVQLDSIHAVP